MARALLFVVVATALFVAPWALEVDWLGLQPGRVRFSVLALWAVLVMGWPVLAAAPQRASRLGPQWGATALHLALPLPFLALAASTHGTPLTWLLVATCCYVVPTLVAAFARRTRASRTVWALATVVIVASSLHQGLPRGFGRLIGGASSGTEAAPTAPPDSGGRLARARVSLEGPLRSATVSLGGGAPLRIDAGPAPGLIQGERRTVMAWVVAPVDEELARRAASEMLGAVPERVGPDGRVRVELVEPRGGRDANAVGVALASRSGPTLERTRSAPPFSALLLCLSVAVAQVSLAIRLRGQRARSVEAGRALALAALAVLGAWGSHTLGAEHAARNAATSPHLRVLEGLRLGTETRWLQVDRFRGELAASPGVVADARSSIRVVDPGIVASTRLAVAGPGSSATAGSGPAAAVMVAPRNAAVDLLRPLEPGFRLVTEDVNTWGGFDAIWTLEAGAAGVWAAHGVWPLGDPLPAESADPGVRPPPAWVTRQLPQGVRILVGKLRPEAFSGLSGPDGRAPGPSETWLRLVGF